MEDHSSSRSYPASALHGRATEGVVVLHIAEDGSYDLRVWGAETVQVLWIDDRSPGDRVYRADHRETDHNALRELIGGDRIGHAGDGHLDEQTVQAIRAMAWRMEGGRLSATAQSGDHEEPHAGDSGTQKETDQ